MLQNWAVASIAFTWVIATVAAWFGFARIIFNDMRDTRLEAYGWLAMAFAAALVATFVFWRLGRRPEAGKI